MRGVARAFAFDRSVRKSLACRASGCPGRPGMGRLLPGGPMPVMPGR